MKRWTLLLLSILLTLSASAGTGKIIILNADATNVGFNDPTPVAPIGGNPGTTRGQQRMNVFLAAAEGWRKQIDTDVDIVASATFSPIIVTGQPCTASAGILGQASPMTWRRDFPNAPLANTWYPIALANKYAATDLEPLQADIFVQFNADVDNATCLGTQNWYYGFDGNEGTDVDLYVVVLHELGHGLGIAGAANTPEFLQNRPAVSDTHIFDRTLGLRWPQMTLQQRLVSEKNTGNLVWDGDSVRSAVDRFLGPASKLTVTSPPAVAGEPRIGLAGFGADLTQTTVSGSLILVADGVAPASDACTPPTNAAALAGNIALADRGTCTFVTKALNAQAAGALALVVVDNDRTVCSPVAPGGTDPSITIPVVSILPADGDAIKAQLTAGTPVTVTLGADFTQKAGVSPEGYLRLYAPCVFEAGSSVRHWDDTARPNLLMEPAINNDLTHDGDLTLNQLIDMGWTSRQGRRFLSR